MIKKRPLALLLLCVSTYIFGCSQQRVEDKLLGDGAALIHTNKGLIILLGDRWERFSTVTPGKPIVVSMHVIDAIFEINQSESVLGIGLAGCSVTTELAPLLSIKSIKYLQIDQSQVEMFPKELFDQEDLLIDVQKRNSDLNSAPPTGGTIQIVSERKVGPGR